MSTDSFYVSTYLYTFIRYESNIYLHIQLSISYLYIPIKICATNHHMSIKFASSLISNSSLQFSFPVKSGSHEYDFNYTDVCLMFSGEKSFYYKISKV